MNIIELERWKPSEADPRKLEYTGQPVAQEVFEELKYRLEGMGYLPDEYFLLDDHWKNGREIPKEADIFCTTDYGSSEGVYLDVYLKWYDENQKKSITKKFITGKTLGENGNDLDRMFLISSAITKVFHGDHATHARYMKIGGFAGSPSKPSEAGLMGKGGARERAQFSPKAETELSGLCDDADTGGRVVHLSQQEEKIIIEALVEQRERQEQAMSQTEQLLRRMTGSITEYINMVGMRPLWMSDYDKAVLAIRDGELETFKEYAAKVPYQQEETLLVEAAGRPGAVGRKMTELLMQDRCNIDYMSYCNACKRAIDINDPEKVLFMMEQAQFCVPQMELTFYGEMASYAHLDHRFIAKEIIKWCGEEQIAAAPSCLLEQFAADKDFRTLSVLVEKGISSGSSAWRTLHMLTCGGHDNWIAEELLKKRMWVNTNDYNTLHACVQNDAVEVCRLLLDGGMDFDQYQQWAQTRPCAGHEETLQALADHWAEMQAEQALTQEIGGQTFG